MSKSKLPVTGVGAAMAAGGFVSTQLAMAALPKAALVAMTAAGVFAIMMRLLRPRAIP